MSKLLDEAIEAVRKLPEAQQDAAGELLLALAERRDYALSAAQIEGIGEARTQVVRGDFASEESVGRVFGKRFG